MRKYLYYLFLFIKVFHLFSQDITSELPMGFRQIVMGLSLEEAKVVISNDGYFKYTGDPDVSMLLSDNRAIIECSGYSYIKNGYFQFYNETLYTITLVLDPKEIDYHSIFTQFIKKYGKYSKLTPSIVTWENSEIIITMEKPLTIKYVGKKIYDKIIEEDTTQKAIQEQLRQDFINEF